MKLKSSNKKSLLLLTSLGIITLLLFSIQFIVNTTDNEIVKPPKFEQKTTLNSIQVIVNEKQYNKLKKKRNKALAIGTLETSDDDYVSAIITYNGQDYKADIRLKGDHLDHLRGNQWSFRVKLKGDQTILGMRKFSIHKPATRRYINEWIYHKAVKEENLLGLRYSFAEVGIHIKNKNNADYINNNVGIYAIEENFDKRTIESNNRKESVILKISEDYFWKETKKSLEVDELYAKPNTYPYMNSDLNLINVSPITVYSESKVVEDPILFNYFKLSKNLLEDLRQHTVTLDKVFDVKKLAMQNALLNLFGARHGIGFINLRFYYNPITSMLEPITFDGNAGIKLKEYYHFRFVDKINDSVYLKELALALNKVSQPKYLNNILDKYKVELDNYKKVLSKEFKVKLLNEKNFKANQQIIKTELNDILKRFPEIKLDN